MLSLPPLAMHLLVLESNYAKKLSHAGESCTGQLEAKREKGSTRLAAGDREAQTGLGHRVGRRKDGEVSTYFPDGPVTHPDDIQERGHDLGQELHTLESQGLEDKGDGLDDHGVVVGQGLVSEDTHQGHHGHSRVELIQGQVAHVD